MFENLIKGYFSVQKPLVGISITPEGMIEAVIMDKKSGVITSYARKEIEFNPIKKMTEDLDSLSVAIEDIKKEFNLQQGTPVVVNLPSFYLGFCEADINSQVDDDIRKNILAEVEQSYMFKQNVPVISVCKNNFDAVENPKVIFCAAQKNVIHDIRDALLASELLPVKIENSYSSMIKVLQYNGFLSNLATSGGSWGIVVINQNSYTIISFHGARLMDLTEDAIAIRTYEKNEVNYAVASVINSSLQCSDLSSVIIINNASEVSVKEVAEQVGHNYPVFPIENNGQQAEDGCLMASSIMKVSSKIPSSVSSQISLFALGAVVSQLSDNFILDFDLNAKGDDEDDMSFDSDTVNFFNVPVEMNNQNCLKMMFLLGLMLGLPLATIWGAEGAVANHFTEQVNAKQTEIQNIENQIKQYEIPKEEVQSFDPLAEIGTIMKANDYGKLVYDSLSANIPKNMWLTYFYVNKDEATIIRGQSKKVEDVYQFFRDVKKSIKNKDLVLSKISVAEDDARTYEFEITNDGYTQIVKSLLEKNKEYQDKINTMKKEAEERYNNNYWPMYPVVDDSIVTENAESAMKDLQEEMQRLQELDKVGSDKTPNQLPPT